MRGEARTTIKLRLRQVGILLAVIAGAFILLLMSPHLTPTVTHEEELVPTRNVTPASTSMVTVGAPDTSAADRASADLLCSGTDDVEVIQKAIDSLASQRGTLRLLSGTYTFDRTVAVRPGMRLLGSGPEQTTIHFSHEGWLEAFERSKVDQLRITGSGGLLIPESGVQVSDVVASVDRTHSAAFLVYAGGKELEGISFYNCSAVNCGTTGFMNAGEGYPCLIRNIRYEDCSAQNSGNSGERFNDWVVGFDIAETAEVADVTMVRCHAVGNWESGFHEEVDKVIGAVTISNSTSLRNGSKRDQGPPKYGAGFLVGGGTVLLDCVSSENEVGYYCMNGSMLVRCMDSGSQLGFRTTDQHEIVLEQCRAELPIQMAFEALNSETIRATAFRIVDPVSAFQAPIRIGSSHYPSRNISMEVNISGGRGDAAIAITNGDGITISGMIDTDARNGLVIRGADTTDISIRDASIRSRTGGGSGVLIETEVAGGDTIRISDSVIAGASSQAPLESGVRNSGQGLVRVESVSVGYARSDFLNCKVVGAVAAPAKAA